MRRSTVRKPTVARGSMANIKRRHARQEGGEPVEKTELSREILHIFSDSIRKRIEGILCRPDLTEIRLRVNLPLMIRTLRREYYLTEEGELSCGTGNAYIVTPEDIRIIFQKISQYSLFAYKEEVREGFITLKGGHRIGLCGKVYYDGEGKRQLQQISSMNIRIARQITGCCRNFFPYLTEDGCFFNTLLISPPGGGKTTFLRDIIRMLSDGTDYFAGQNVSVVDERSEIGNRTRLSEGFYLGRRTDLLDHCPKADGMLMMLRTMAPQIIAADEIGDAGDIEALRYIRNCGCRLLMTVHGKDVGDILERPFLGEYLRKYPFERYVQIQAEKTGRRRVDIFDARQNRVWRGIT
ncbi:MAG TPA: stage III sporulation protein AA [Candidatus Anaerobutyricum stercoris]|uniref:Stage III sporulation protein AA n=1 Tax=Candidatus Anaerobutyricum stercoris TaxID=2838457 RepID=A0A9D2ELD3_9FIRM|nr:stage III sporulation protein AA [Candidatus Anaerobutyricum stercoris]